jgi:ribonucleoside-diphosphate reductase beta chain
VSIFDRRVAFKPFEYPEVMAFKSAINHSYWLVGEWNFTSDVHDFNIKLSQSERNVVKNALLAISQIEVEVKEFWGRIGERFPKSEFKQIGYTFAESEIRHADAYSHLLEVLGLNADFELLLQNPVIQGRVDYLAKYLRGAAQNTNAEYTLTLTLFSIFIENVSLFSQFVIIKAFNKYKNILKDVDNVVQATQKEETIHALFGVHLIKCIKKEFPEWFTQKFYYQLKAACLKAYEAEVKIIDWIFEAGELDFLPKYSVIEFIKKRFNESLAMVDCGPVFEIDKNKLVFLSWFDDEIHCDVNTDFFHKKPVTYSKNAQAVQAEDIF